MATESAHSGLADADSVFMHLALEEGRKALPGYLPNPPVGCVEVRMDVLQADVHRDLDPYLSA